MAFPLAGTPLQSTVIVGAVGRRASTPRAEHGVAEGRGRLERITVPVQLCREVGPAAQQRPRGVRSNSERVHHQALRPADGDFEVRIGSARALSGAGGNFDAVDGDVTSPMVASGHFRGGGAARTAPRAAASRRVRIRLNDRPASATQRKWHASANAARLTSAPPRPPSPRPSPRRERGRCRQRTTLPNRMYTLPNVWVDAVEATVTHRALIRRRGDCGAIRGRR